MQQNIIAAQFFHDRRQKIGAFTFDQIADEEQANFSREFALGTSFQRLEQLGIDAIINDFDVARAKSSFDGCFRVVTDRDHSIRGAERLANAPFQPTKMKRFLAERRILLIDVLENIMQNGHDKRSIGRFEGAAVVGVDVHQVVIAEARMRLNARTGQCRGDFEIARETDEIQRNAMATDCLFELIKINIVTGAAVRYGYKYFQINARS